MKRDLKTVTLENTDTCLTYALKRLGFANENVNFSHLNLANSPFDSIVDYDVLQIGDLLIWDKNKEEILLPNKINEHGTLIWTKAIKGIHVAVYEGNALASDCSRVNSPSSLPQLKVRHVESFKRMPDRILRPR